MSSDCTPYDDTFRDELRKLLLQHREDTLRDLEFLRHNTIEATESESTHDNSTYASHPADQGSDAQEREMSFMFADRGGKYLEQVDEALKRIDQGTYGKCMSCGDKITVERLRVVPTAKLCKDCKQKYAKSSSAQ